MISSTVIFFLLLILTSPSLPPAHEQATELFDLQCTPLPVLSVSAEEVSASCIYFTCRNTNYNMSHDLLCYIT